MIAALALGAKALLKRDYTSFAIKAGGFYH
jgi:hypothetical protein